MQRFYRPPSARAEWINTFHNMLNIPYGTCQDIVVIGDFNFNILNESNNNKTWEHTVNHFNLKQMVKEPTRVTENTCSLIDHIYTTDSEMVKNIQVPHIRLSDHFPVYFSLCHK